MGYANFIIQPILVFVNHTFVNSAFTVILWALVGSFVAAGLGAAANALNDWRNTRDDVAMPTYGVVIRHPLQHNLVMRFVWRLAIGTIIVAFTVIALFTVRYIFGNDVQILSAASIGESAWRFALSVALWAVLCHGYVVLLRLYVQRTRLFGEILY